MTERECVKIVLSTVRPDFPSTILESGQQYYYKCVYIFKVK